MDLLSEPWRLEFHSGIPVYKQIINLVQTAIADGRLRVDDQLPTVRALHKKLKVNPNTVAKAYRELELGGYITTERGSGCFVAPVPTPSSLSTREKKAAAETLSRRVAAEARSHGIPLQTLIQNLSRLQTHG